MTTPLTVYTAPMPEPWASLLTDAEQVWTRIIAAPQVGDTALWDEVWRWSEGFQLTRMERVRGTATRILDLCRAAEALAATLETPK